MSAIGERRIGETSWPSESPSDYRARLKTLVEELGSLEETTWKDARWGDLVQYLTQNDLDWAFQSKNEVAKAFRLLHPGELYPTQNMDMLRFRIQFDSRLSRMPFEDAVHSLRQSFPKYYYCHSQQEPKKLTDVTGEFVDRFMDGQEPDYFTLLSDFLNFDIQARSIPEIEEIASHIQLTAEEKGGYTHRQESGSLENLAKRLYVYLPRYGLMQFQIMRPKELEPIELLR